MGHVHYDVLRIAVQLVFGWFGLSGIIDFEWANAEMLWDYVGSFCDVIPHLQVCGKATLP